MSKLKLNWHEFLFVILVGVFGFLASMKSVIVGLNKLNPIAGFFVYYFIWFGIVFALSLTGFMIFGHKIKNPFQIIGTLLIVFSVNVILNFTSGYTVLVASGSMANNLQILLASEDGLLWHLFYNVLGITNIFVSRILTYVISPMILSVIGVFLVKKVDLDMFG